MWWKINNRRNSFNKKNYGKAYECKVNLELMFTDFQRALDSIKKNKLINALVEIKIDFKLIRLIRMTIKSTIIKISTGAGKIDRKIRCDYFILLC